MTSHEKPPGRHLFPEQFEGYRRRTLSPADLLEVDDHLSDCARCRDHLLGQMLPDAGIDSWEEPETELPHFSADDMAAHADGGSIRMRTSGSRHTSSVALDVRCSCPT